MGNRVASDIGDTGGGPTSSSTRKSDRRRRGPSRNRRSTFSPAPAPPKTARRVRVDDVASTPAIAPRRRDGRRRARAPHGLHARRAGLMPGASRGAASRARARDERNRVDDGALARAAAGGDRSRQARLRRPGQGYVRGSDAVGAGRPMARRSDQARPREGVPGDGRRRRCARNSAGSAARGRRAAKSEAQSLLSKLGRTRTRAPDARRSEIRRRFFLSRTGRWTRIGTLHIALGLEYRAPSLAGNRRRTAAAQDARAGAVHSRRPDRHDRGGTHRHGRARNLQIVHFDGLPLRRRAPSVASSHTCRRTSPCGGRSRCPPNSALLIECAALHVSPFSSRDPPGTLAGASLVPSAARRRRDVARRQLRCWYAHFSASPRAVNARRRRWW